MLVCIFVGLVLAYIDIKSHFFSFNSFQASIKSFNDKMRMLKNYFYTHWTVSCPNSCMLTWKKSQFSHFSCQYRRKKNRPTTKRDQPRIISNKNAWVVAECVCLRTQFYLLIFLLDMATDITAKANTQPDY